MAKASAEDVAWKILRRRKPLTMKQRRRLRWVIEALEEINHGLTCEQWQQVLELLDPAAYHYRLPSQKKKRRRVRPAA